MKYVILILLNSFLLVKAFSFRESFHSLLSDTYSDCLSSYTSLTSNYKQYCDSGKQLIQECDFDEENFECDLDEE